MLYQSPRRFEVFGWGVGHRGLLLRSNPTEECGRRVEVLFKPAYAVCLPAWLDGISISTADQVRSGTWEAQEHGLRLSHDENLFIVTSGSIHGWVVAGSVTGREDSGDYSTPTTFTGWSSPPDVRKLFSTYDG